jgi:single-stranded-DNA-specific exonuclease
LAIKYWNLPADNRQLAVSLSAQTGLPAFVTEILVNRGYTTFGEMDEFFGAEEQFEDPYVLADMSAAVERIRQGVENFEKIAVYGDYDCDGVTSTALLYSYLNLLGANVIYYIPSREGEGYGLHRESVKQLAEQGVELMITVDNGISALEEIDYANSLGMDVIVTDHHQVGETLPNAVAVVNPHRKDCPSTFKQLAGVGVAFKLVTALEDGDYSCTLEQFGDLVAIGTVGDVVPLTGENRSFVRRGLELLSRTDNIGLVALMQVANLNPEHLNSQNIAFGICPRINAAGRMGDASLAVRLLLSDTPEEAQQLAQQMAELNQMRKQKEEAIVADIQNQIQHDPQVLYDRVLTFYQEGWHPGVIGIVSSKVLEQYGKPNLLMALQNGQLCGSARSVAEFPLYEALCSCSEHLIRYGGHKQAAGFLLEEGAFPGFKEQLEHYAAKHYRVMPSFTYDVDKQIFPEELNLQNIKRLDLLEPFGAENQPPLFLLKEAKLMGIQPVSEGKHLRLKLDFGSVSVSAMYFGVSPQRFLYEQGQTLDLLANISVRQYNGREYLSAVVRDLRPSGFLQQNFFNAKTYYEMFRRGECCSASVLKKATPTREETAVVYLYLKKHGGFSGDVESLGSTFLVNEINYFKFRLILDCLQDVGLIRISPLLDGITLCPVEGKVDLFSGETMRKLKDMENVGGK